MWRSRFAFASLMLPALAFLAGATPAQGGLSILSQTARVDASAGQVSFDLVFNHPPDLVPADTYGRRAESFQYEIVPDSLAPVYSSPESAIRAVIRGEEIGGGSIIPIRDGFENGIDPSPAAGGWGAVRGSVPFTIQGDQLSFVAPFSLLGTTDGRFSYVVFTTSYGLTDSTIQDVTVPLPAALPAGLATLLLVGGGIWFWRRRRLQR
ncbi:MAG TPA: hypothetical protein VFC78_08695 [Tepidisphaeraceae bacterium]|nr:hypothetical protein [Tepidisphaeraceae bacterium]